MAAIAAAAAIAAVAGCGDGNGDGDGNAGDVTQTTSAASLIREAGLPRPANRSLRELIERMQQGPELAPSTSVLVPGRNRFGFGLLDRSNAQIADLEVGLYVARGLDETVRGPYPADYREIEVKPQFRSKTSSSDPGTARAVYVSELRFPGSGAHLVVAMARLGNRVVATSPVQLMVAGQGQIPAPGDRAIRISTPTEASAGDIEKIETRVPPDTMHEADFADVLGKKPVLLLFSTPGLCQSRVCGPVTDVAEQVKSELGDEAAFIHMEIYKDNDAGRGTRPQVRAWHLESEPWAFAVDRRGVVAERLEGAFTVPELRAAVRKAAG